ncbi:MAG: efflux RND transporter periplasmic adaptor subunit [Parvularculaceae bacterium]
MVVEEARRETISDTIEAIGPLRANEMVEITALMTERVARIGFDDGMRVRAGDVLVEFARGEENARLAEVRAARREADAELARSRQLATRNAASDTELAERRRAAEVAAAQESAIAAQIADRVITAPFHGVVGIRTISVGSTVAPGDVITRLVDDSVMKLDFSVPAPFLTQIAPGSMVEATTRAFGDKAFRGEIASIDSVVDPVTRTVLVRALIPNEDRLLRPGLLMEIDLIANRRAAIVVDERALIPEGEEQFVYVVSSGPDGALTAERRRIETGARRVGEIEALSGLAPGDRVVVEGAIKLRPGAPVTLQDGPDQAEAAATRKADARSRG